MDLFKYALIPEKTQPVLASDKPLQIKSVHSESMMLPPPSFSDSLSQVMSGTWFPQLPGSRCLVNSKQAVMHFCPEVSLPPSHCTKKD